MNDLFNSVKLKILQGFIQNFHFFLGVKNAHSIQCPMSDTECPTCSEFRNIQNVVQSIREEFTKTNKTNLKIR